MTDYISIRVILDNCLNHPLLQDLTLERAVAYAVDFIRIVGMPPMFLEKTEIIEIKDWRGQLPCDFHKMIQVRLKERVSNCCNDTYEGSGKVFRYTTDSFHMSDSHESHNELTYKL